MHARLANALGLLNGSTPRPAAKAAPPAAKPSPGPDGPARMIPGVPAAVTAKLLEQLGGDGTTASLLGDAIGTGKTKAYEYLKAARKHGAAAQTGQGPASRWILAAPPGGGEAEPRRPYGTIEKLAEAVSQGAVDVDEDTRYVLLQCHQVARRNKGHLNLVQNEPGDQE